MKSKFALSFGIALIFIGVVNFFLETNNVIMFGISLSAFIFSIISILFATKVYEEKYEFLYIIPFVVMLSFLCYGNELMKINYINEIVNSQLTSALTFISFGLSFASEYIAEKNFRMFEKIRHISLALETMNYTNLLQDAVIEHRCELNDKKIIPDEASKNFVDHIERLFNEKAKQCRMVKEMLSKKADKYTIDEIIKVFNEENEILKVKPLEEKKKRVEESLKNK